MSAHLPGKTHTKHNKVMPIHTVVYNNIQVLDIIMPSTAYGQLALYLS